MRIKIGISTYTMAKLSKNENIKLKVAVKYETIWIMQKGMAKLFGVNIPAISKQLANIFNEREVITRVNCF